MKLDLGKRGIALAIVVTLVVPLALGLMFYPPAHMELKGLPFGLLSLDEGIEQGGTDINLGDELASSIESGDFASMLSEDADEEADDSPLAEALSFTVFESQEQLDEALENGELYGALVIPSDFTEKQLAAVLRSQMEAQLTAQAGAQAEAPAAPQAGASATPQAEAQAAASAAQATAGAQSSSTAVEKPVLSVRIDYAKSPLVATQMEGNLGNAFSALGVEADIEVVNKGAAADVDGANMFSGMFSQMMVIMPLLICSLLAGLLAVLGFDVKGAGSAGARVRRFVACLVLGAVASFLIALMCFWLVAIVAGLAVDFWPYVSFIWMCSFFLMVFFSGCATLKGRLAVAMGVIIILLGMTTGYLPYEALPAFWQEWVCPWAPQYYIGAGLREVIFAGGDIWNQATVACSVYALVGLVVGCLGALVSGKLGKHASKSASL